GTPARGCPIDARCPRARRSDSVHAAASAARSFATRRRAKRRPPGPLLAEAASGHLPDGLDFAVSEPDDVVRQVAARAGVIRVEANLFAELDGFLGAAHAVLLGEPLDDHPAIDRFRHGRRRAHGVASPHDATVTRERLAPAVDG